MCSAANGADKKTGANAQEKRMDEAPTQEEDSLDLDLQPTQQLSLKQVNLLVVDRGEGEVFDCVSEHTPPARRP